VIGTATGRFLLTETEIKCQGKYPVYGEAIFPKCHYGRIGNDILCTMWCDRILQRETRKDMRGEFHVFRDFQ
jgi:hypothetical protein